jgi:transcriptional regulator with XRE-family HTH domain
MLTAQERELGELLEWARQHCGLTLRKVAGRLKCTPGYLSRVEKKGEIPSPWMLCEMADLYLVHASQFLRARKAALVARRAEALEIDHLRALEQWHVQRGRNPG